MADPIANQATEDQTAQDEKLNFWGNWRNLYAFILIYGILQIVILYWFTRTFNQP